MQQIGYVLLNFTRYALAERGNAACFLLWGTMEVDKGVIKERYSYTQLFRL
jgi:hypothetical protein